MINETTPHLGLQLPHPSNTLEDDVLRLRSAINGIDTKFQALDALLASDDPSLNSIQELVSGIKQNTADLIEHIGSGGDVHANATTAAAGFMSASDKSALDGHIGFGGAAHANATASAAGFMSSGDKSALDGHLGSGGGAHAAATASAAGFMPAADKSKLDGVTLGVLLDSVVTNVAADGGTALTVAGGYVAGSIMVFMNGAKLTSADYTATDGSAITLASGALAADEFEIVRFKRALAA